MSTQILSKRGRFDQLKPTSKNDIGAEKWGFAKSKSDLDTAVGPGESAYIDHDENIFYWVLKSKIGEDYNKYVEIVTVGGTAYASLPGGDYQYHYAGLGANSDASHQTDFDWKSTNSGASWEKNESSVDVSGLEATLEIRKYSEAVTDLNAQSVLATGGEVVFGPQEMTCDKTISFRSE